MGRGHTFKDSVYSIDLKTAKGTAYEAFRSLVTGATLPALLKNYKHCLDFFLCDENC